MPKTIGQNQEISNKRREQILEASLEEFSQKGFSGTKISDIVRRAGISGLSAGKWAVQRICKDEKIQFA